MCIKGIAEQKQELLMPRYLILFILDFTVLYVALTTANHWFALIPMTQ